MTAEKPTSGRKTFHTGSHWGVYDVEVEAGRVVGIRPFAKDPNPSPFIRSMQGMVHDRTRISQPMVRKSWLERRTGSDRDGRGREAFVPVDWETALDLVAGEIGRVKEDFGPASIYAGSYGWSSCGKLHQARHQLQRFMACAGGFTTSVGSYSFSAGLVISPRVVGTIQPVIGPQTDWRSIEESCELMVLFGGLPLKNGNVDSGGSAQHMMEVWQRRLKAAGIKFVSFSPVKDDAADFLDAEWHAIRPGTDVPVMLAIAHTLVTKNLHDREFLGRYAVGFERFLPYLMGETDGTPKTPEWAAPIAEVDPSAIRALARRMSTSRTMINVSWSLQRTHHGEQPFWMAITLAAMLGQIGLPGGGFAFGYGATDGMGKPRIPIRTPSYGSIPNPIKSYIPVARIADMLLEPGKTIDFDGNRVTYPDIRMIWWAGGNPFHHHQDLNKLRRAWTRPKTIVVNEPWWTPVARHADIVLPATTTLERNDIGASMHDRFFFAMQKAIDPVGQARNDIDIFADIGERLGCRERFTEGRTEMEWLRHMYDVARQQAAQHEVEMPDFDTFWEAGHVEFPEPDAPFVMFGDFRADPEKHRLNTPSGRIEIFSETVASFGYDDCAGHPKWFEPIEWLGSEKTEVWPLHLISNQPRTRLHSQTDNGPVSRGAKINGREAMWIHPADAVARGIADGDVVRVYNDRGACLAGAVVTDQVRVGVIQLATGAWYDPVGGGVDGLEAHGNPNVLTVDIGTSKLGQGPIAHTALVEVERYAEALPPITVFSEPAIA
jgi:biotin/methionine sulfoxide reductase